MDLAFAAVLVAVVVLVTLRQISRVRRLSRRRVAVIEARRQRAAEDLCWKRELASNEAYVAAMRIGLLRAHVDTLAELGIALEDRETPRLLEVVR